MRRVGHGIRIGKFSRARFDSYRSKDYKKVPIMTIGTNSYFGSDKIIQGLLEQPVVLRRLQDRWSGEDDGRMTPEKFSKSAAPSSKWIAFSDNELAPLLYPNMCRTIGDAYAAFAYVNQVPEFSPLQRLAIRGIGSLAMYMAASRVKSTCANVSSRLRVFRQKASRCAHSSCFSDLQKSAESPMNDGLLTGLFRYSRRRG
jgi:hypothetical protein